MKTISALIVVASFAAAPAMAVNLLTNGDFESSSATTTTPPGWANIGHMDGVVAYSLFSTPAYDGLYFYDLGGFGDPFGPVGDGITQTVATVAGAAYTLTFGLSSEDKQGPTELSVLIGGQTSIFALPANGTSLGKPFTMMTLSYVATSAFTTISFIETANAGGGNNDPLIDGVSFTGASAPAPEPATWAMMLGGFAAIGGALRSRRAPVVFFG